MKTIVTTLNIAVASLLLVQPCKANKERPRSVDEMQSASGIILDGTVTNVVARKKPPPSNNQADALLSDDYDATFKVERTHKGQITDQTVLLIYSRISDSRFKGDNPPMLKVGDRFRLFADSVESSGPPPVIRVRSVNAVRPEAVEKESAAPSPNPEATHPRYVKPPSMPLIPTRPPEAKPTVPTPNEESASSTPWSIIVVLIVAATGLLWLLLKRRA